MEEIRDKILSKIESYRDEMIELQRRLTAIPAMSPDYKDGKGEMEKALFFLDYLQKNGFVEIERYDAPDERVPEKVRANFVVRMKGKSSERKFCVMAHLDVVPPGNLKSWKGDPWILRIEGDSLIGRGTEDNHQGLISGLFAMKAFKDLNMQPEYDACLIVVSDEETGSKFGIDYVLKNSNLFGKEDLIVVPDAGIEDGSMIEVAEKSIVWIEIETTGKECHASTPALGINAHRASAELIVELDDLHKKYSKKDPVYDPPESTFEPTRKMTNVSNINTIPGTDVIFYDCRILPDYDVDDVIKFIRDKADKIEKKFNVKIQMKFPQLSKAAPPTPVKAPIVKMLTAAIKRIYNVEAKPMGIGGGTVAAFFRRHGYNAAVWSKILDIAHQPEESCSISNMVNDTKVFADVMLQKF
jgi:succinyl-diaminopimelate desuccinylase